MDRFSLVRCSTACEKLKKEGIYDIACAEMCGTYHYRMQAKMTVYGQEAYQEWLNEAEKTSITDNELDNADIYWGWKWDAV